MWKVLLSSLFLVLGGCDRSQSPSAFPARGPDDVAAPEGAPAPPPRADVADAKEAGKTVYVCPMHPEVVSKEPGTCPKCNMHLEPKPAPDGGDHADHDSHAHDSHAHDSHAHDSHAHETHTADTHAHDGHAN